MASDASFAGDVDDRRSQGGYLGGFTDMPPDTYSSTKSSRVATSTFHAESLFASSAAKQAVYVYLLHAWLRVSNGDAIKLALDNQATILQAAAPVRKWSPRSKHFDIDAKYLTEAVERGEVYVYHASGAPPSDKHDGFPCDALTKALPSSVLTYYIPLLQGNKGLREYVTRG